MFVKPRADQAREAAAHLPRALPYLLGLRRERLAGIRAVADAGQYSTDWRTTLAAVADYYDKAKRADLRHTEVQLATVLIAAGAPSGQVARQLGVGRDRLHRVLTETHPSLVKARVRRKKAGA